MKKILLVIFLTISSFSFAKDEYNLEGVHGDEFIMCVEFNRGARGRLVSCINDSISKGYQLYGDTNMDIRDGQSWSQSLVKK
tara:strand:+ start:181 stop:426 length:246 start_codon:yes stop_codon:yes gene_type:complete